jgi:hypothetical protein
MSGPEGIRHFPPAPDVPFEDAVTRQLLALDNALSASRAKAVIADRGEDDVRRALLATRRARPDDVLAFFAAALGPAVPRDRITQGRSETAPLRAVEDPYAT